TTSAGVVPTRVSRACRKTRGTLQRRLHSRRCSANSGGGASGTFAECSLAPAVVAVVAPWIATLASRRPLALRRWRRGGGRRPVGSRTWPVTKLAEGEAR